MRFGKWYRQADINRKNEFDHEPVADIGIRL